jgi:cytochrome P450
MLQDFNPLLPETFDSPHEEYRRLRRECPVAHSDAWGGYWALHKHADVAAAANDSDLFITSKQNVVPKVATTGRRPPLHLDPPEHTPYRRAIAPLLTSRTVERLRPFIEQTCRELLKTMVAEGGGDICDEYASRMPVRTFAQWMNLPENQVERLSHWGKQFNVAVQSADASASMEASTELYDLARELIAERKAAPLDPAVDATSALLAVRVAGTALPDELILGTIRQVLVVGIIAPTVMIGSICVHLSRDRALQDRLRGDLSLVPAAVEEFLRLYTPYRGFARTVTRDVCLRGRTIPEGEPVALVYASANRDEDVFEDPDSFKLNRANIAQSLHFGRGTHNCPGAALARLELQVALTELLTGTRSFHVAGEIVPTRMPEIGALHVPLAFA